MENYETINIQFILSKIHNNEDECSEDMLVCFKWCVENTMSPKWVKEENCFDLNPGKKDVFVFEKFEGNAFAYLQKFKCVIVGPRALLNCISEGKPIPKSGCTIFTNAMRDCFVSCTSLDEKEKENLRLKVIYMGGMFDGKRLLSATTHLVAGNVLSNKYKQAVEAKILIMTKQWVEAVWEASFERNIRATDKEFEHFKCPAFLGLNITTSNLPRRDKEGMKLLIETNGGVYQGSLQGRVTNMLVIKGSQGEKYKFAREFSLPCVEPKWVSESAKVGHAIDTKIYEVSRKCSTPVDNHPFGFPPDMSVLSSISYAHEPHDMNAVVNETAVSATNSHVPRQISTSEAEPSAPMARVLEALSMLDVKTVKAAGHFLDGCKVFSTGFGSDASEKLRRVLNAGGATRFNEISDSVSHVIVGNTPLETIEQMLQSTTRRPSVVTLEWVLESIEIQGRAPEDKYLLSASKACTVSAEPPSPSLKKSLQMLRTPSVTPLVLDFAVPEDQESVAAGQLIPQYLRKDKAADADGTLFKIPPRRATETHEPREPQPTEVFAEDVDSQEDDSSQIIKFFEGLKFLIVGFDDEDYEIWTDMITGVGGEVVSESYRGVPDYGIVPFEGAQIHHATKEVVSNLWLETCAQTNSKAPVEYYHLPVAVPSVKPMKGCVLGISSYLYKERDFLILLSEALGAVSQDVFARRDCPPKQVLASTHLVCSEPGSSKYLAAVKWRVPTVSHKWLLACLRERRLADVEPYRVADGTVLSPTLAATESAMRSDRSTEKTSATNTSSSANKTKPQRTPIASLNECDTASSTMPLVPEKSRNKEAEPVVVNTADNGHDENADTSNRSRANVSTNRPTTPLATAPAKLDTTPLTSTRLSTSLSTPTTPRLSTSTTPGPRESTTPEAVTTVPHDYGFSQETPIRFPRLGADLLNRRSSGNGTPGYVGTPDMPTPETPYGYGFTADPSPNTRKAVKRWIDKGPDLQRKESPERPAKKRNSTPLNVLHKRCWDKWAEVIATQTEERSAGPSSQLCVEQESMQSAEEVVENRKAAGAGAYTQLNQLDQLLKAGTSNASSVEEGGKLPRRPSLMESSTGKAAATTRAASDDKAVEGNLKESQWSQSNDVGWEFHARRVESREASPSVADVNNSLSKSAHEGPFKFILSTMSGNDREIYKEVVQSLGGMVSDAAHFDLSATHLVCMKPSRSEKMLACIASGKWVVHSSYLDKSKQAGYFLQEENHEFGNPAAADNLPALTGPPLEARLAAACFRWRTRLTLNKTEKGAFHDMRAIIWTNPEKVDSFKRLIVAGGGFVVDSRPPFSNKTTATHLFIDGSKTRDVVDYQNLVKNGVLCLPLMFLNNFLVEHPTPVAADHVIPEAAQTASRLSKRNKK